MTKKIFLFDLDWTLVTTGGSGIRALNRSFEKHFQIAEAMNTITPDGKTDYAIVREMIRGHLGRDPKEGEIESVCRGYLDGLKIEVPSAAQYRVLPGILE